MPTLIEALKRKISEKVVVGAGDNVERRIAFSGPTLEIMRSLLAAFVVEGGLTLLTGEALPVLMLDKDVQLNPADFASGPCTEAHVIGIRNSDKPYFLLLLPPHQNANLSLETTYVSIGVKGVDEDTADWKWWEQPFVQELTRDLSEVLGDIAIDSEVLKRAFDDAGAVSSQSQSRAHQWNLFDKLYSLSTPGKGNLDKVLAMVGVPRCELSGVPNAYEALQSIAARLNDEGITRAIEGWVARAKDLELGSEVEEALGEFGKYLQYSCYAPVFYQAPTYWYSPLRRADAGAAVPNWWMVLGLEVWLLLVSEEEAKPKYGIELAIANSAFQIGSAHVVMGDVEFEVTAPEDHPLLKVELRRGPSSSSATSIAKFTTRGRRGRAKDSPPPGRRATVYRAEATELAGSMPGKASVVSLSSFEARAVFYSPLAEKVTLPRLQSKKQDGKKVWASDIVFSGPGAHQVDVLVDTKCSLSEVARVRRSTDEGSGSGGEPEEVTVEQGFDGRKTIRLNVLESLTIEFLIELEGGEELVLKASCVLEQDEIAQGFRSEYQRLVAVNAAPLKASGSATVLPRWSYLERLQSALIKEKDSYRPSVISVDALHGTINFDWSNSAIFSKYKFITDIRPPGAEFQPPPRLLECRQLVQGLFKDKEVEVLETSELAGWLDVPVTDDGPPLKAVLVEYIREYAQWVESSKDVALWFDTVSYILPQENTEILSPRPQAVLLSPLHPLRLGWQCLAQKVMQDAIDAGKTCAGSTYFEPSSVPDAMPLWLWGAAGTASEAYYLALDNDSDYWSILWDSSSLAALNTRTTIALFSDAFGLKVEGLAAGLSEAQIERTLSDIAQIRSARNSLNVRVLTDSEARTFCNEGIIGWATQNLGPHDTDRSTGDSWAAAGARRLEVYDLRKERDRPAPEDLQNLTSATAGAVKWRFKDKDSADADVSIIGNLKLLAPASEQQEDVVSAIGWGALLHRRVRRQMPDSKVVLESRRSVYRGDVDDDLAIALSNLTTHIEGLSTLGNALSFVPNTELLQAELQKSLYCAVSASVADPASFFNISEEAYLWEFDMPSPGTVSGPSHGYYLLARQTPSILEAVRKTLAKAMPAAAGLDQKAIAKLMREASSRGTPELRKWAAGGSGASGEIGVVVALRLLQGARQNATAPAGLLGNDDEYTNLLIPVDPFEGPIDALREGHANTFERPDILVASIRIQGDGKVVIRLTPVEVKYRSAKMVENYRKWALQQATEFSKFLSNLCQHHLADAPGSRLWALSKCALLADLIDFGFRIEANLDSTATSQERAAKESAVLAAILGDKAHIEIDPRGRLILIDKADESQCLDYDGSSLFRTIELSEQDAVSLLNEDEPAIVKNLLAQVQDWQLKAKPLIVSAAASNDAVNLERATESNITFGSGGTEATAPVSAGNSNSVASQTSQMISGNSDNSAAKAIIEMPDAVGASGDAPVHAPALPVPIQEATGDGKGVNFPVGRSVNPLNPNQEFSFWPSNTELTHLNVGILGDLGTGKTQMVKALIYQLARSASANRGERVKFLILDYKGDYIDEEFKARVGSTVYKPQLLPINLFDLSAIEGKSLTPWLDRFNFFSDTLSKIHNVVAPVQKQRLKDAVRASYEWAKANGFSAPTIYQVFDQYKAIVGDAVDVTYSILSDLVDRQVFEPSLEKIKPFSELLDGVFVLDLKSLGADDKSKNMLVAIFLNLFYEYMLNVPKKGFVGTSPQLRALDSVLLVDEADNIMRLDFDVLNRILVEDREFGVGVWLSSQYFDHFNKTDINYAQPLLTWFIHRVPSISMNQLRSLGLSAQSANNDTLGRIQSLRKHECLYKSLGVDGKFMRGYPFYELVEKDEETH